MESSNKAKKKQQIFKKYSLCFPFTYEYKIISGDQSIDYWFKRMKLLFNFNSETRKAIKFGYNSCVQITEDEKYSSSECLIFMFYLPSWHTLIDMLIWKCKRKLNNLKLYLLDAELKKEFVKWFKIKKCLCYAVIKNDKNAKVIDEISANFAAFNSNNENWIPVYRNNVKEITIEK